MAISVFFTHIFLLPPPIKLFCPPPTTNFYAGATIVGSRSTTFPGAVPDGAQAGGRHTHVQNASSFVGVLQGFGPCGPFLATSLYESK